MRAYDDDRIARISADVSEAIELAALGQADWSDVAARFVDGFPAAFFSIINQDFTNDRVNFFAECNVAPDYLASYMEHYAYVNPWVDIWARTPAGVVLVAEQHCPARAFPDSEFYNDWVLPQRTVEAASGVKIDGGLRDLVHVPVHYPMHLRKGYDPATSAVLKRIAGPLRRAVRLARHLSDACRTAAAAGAVAQRFDHAAIVCDARMTVIEANERALAQFGSGRVIRSVGGKLSMTNPAHHGVLARHVHSLVAGHAPECDEYCFVADGDVHLMQLCRIRLPASRVGVLFPYPPHALILLKNVTRSTSGGAVARFARHHRLTPAETRFCERLLAGDSPVEAAGRLAITENTARQRLKTIFHKAGVGRQAELVRTMLAFK